MLKPFIYIECIRVDYLFVVLVGLFVGLVICFTGGLYTCIYLQWTIGFSEHSINTSNFFFSIIIIFYMWFWWSKM